MKLADMLRAFFVEIKRKIQLSVEGTSAMGANPWKNMEQGRGTLCKLLGSQGSITLIWNYRREKFYH